MLSTRPETEARAPKTLIDLIHQPDAYGYVIKNRSQVQRYFEDPALFNTCDDEGQTPFHYAAAMSSIPMAKFLLEQGFDVNVLNEQKETALFSALYRYDEEDFKKALVWVQFFIEHKCDVSLRNVAGQSVVEALLTWFMKMVRSMPSSALEEWVSGIDFSPLVTLILLTPRSVLDYTAEGGYLDSLLFVFRDFVFQTHASRLLSSLPAFMRLISDLVQAMNPVNSLEVRGFIERGELLPVARYIQDDPDYKDSIDNDGNDLLMKAVMSQYSHIVYYLVDHHFSLSQFNKDGKSALMLAVEGGNLDILKCLLSKATEKELKAFQKKELTLLSVAMDCFGREMKECVIGALLDKIEGSTLFHLIDRGRVSEVDAYLRSKSSTIFTVAEGVNDRLIFNAQRQSILSSIYAGENVLYINRRGRNGESALHRLVSLNFLRTLRGAYPQRLPFQSIGIFADLSASSWVTYNQMMLVFTAHGIDLHAVDNQGNTALMMSAKTPVYFITNDLIARGLNVNAQNLDGETALMMAARMGRVETVRGLINGGADIQLKNKEGKTAFDLTKNKSVLELLRSAETKKYHERDSGETSAPKRMKR